MMPNPNEMNELEILASEIRTLRKQREDLLHRLRAYEEQAAAPSGTEFPLSEYSRLTDGIIHDMRSGLGVIRSTIIYMGHRLAKTDKNMADIQKINHSLTFCELVLRNLSALGGQDIFQPQRVNIESIVREVFFMLERKLVEVHLIVETDGPTEIVADEGQMKQVFMNLIKNAGEAMQEGGRLTFRTRQSLSGIHIELSDTGSGISPEHQQLLFRDFFTTKKRGYGLGLHIVKTIIDRHRGTIQAQSEVGVGTTFIIELPWE